MSLLELMRDRQVALRFAADEHASRLAATRAVLRRRGCAALLVFAYAFAGFTAGFFVAFAAAAFAGFLLPAAFAARGLVAGFFLAAVLLFVFVIVLVSATVAAARGEDASDN